MPRVKLRLAFYLLRAIKRRTGVSRLAYVQSPYRNRVCLAREAMNAYESPNPVNDKQAAVRESRW
jgi:hypothetical protein